MGKPQFSSTVVIRRIISVSSNYGSYYNIPIDAYGDEKSVTMSGSGIYGRVSYSGVAKGKKEDDQYSGTWYVTLVREPDGKARTYSGKWKWKGNYTDICKIDTVNKALQSKKGIIITLSQLILQSNPGASPHFLTQEC
jgi:hypothetical protein